MSYTPGSITLSLEEWKNRYNDTNLKLRLAENELQELRIALAQAQDKIDDLEKSLKEGLTNKERVKSSKKE